MILAPLMCHQIHAYSTSPAKSSVAFTPAPGVVFLNSRCPKLRASHQVKVTANNLAERIDQITGDQPLPMTGPQIISHWLTHLQKTHFGLRKDSAKLRAYYIHQHIIKASEVPEAYFELQKRIATARGEEIDLSVSGRKELVRRLIQNQTESLLD